MWKFIIKQDRLIVARGYGKDKECVINECFHYLSLYSEEDFKKMTMEIKETGEE